MIWAKLGIGVAGLLAIAIIGWRVSVWHDKAERLGAAEAALEQERAAHIKTVETFATRMEEFTLAQEALSTDLAGIRKKFADLNIPATLVRTVEVPGDPCPAVRLDPSFVGVWNESSSP